MNTKIAASLLAAALLSASAFAQAPDTNSSQPASNSPVVTPTQPAPPQMQAQAPAPTSAPNQLVYVPRLPSAQELTNIAAAQGRTVERIEQNSSQIVLVYRDANGGTQSVAYQLLPQAGATQPQQTTVVAPSPAPTTTTVYYETAPRVVYYDTYPRYYYSPYYSPYYYPPVSLSLGFGYYRGWGGGYRGGWGGGYHGGWHGHR